jgi:hypothetical protein
MKCRELIEDYRTDEYVKLKWCHSENVTHMFLSKVYGDHPICEDCVKKARALADEFPDTLGKKYRLEYIIK